MRQAKIYRKDIFTGFLTEDGGEYRFCYDEAYLARMDAQALPKWQTLIQDSFLSEDMKCAYMELISSRLARLQR